MSGYYVITKWLIVFIFFINPNKKNANVEEVYRNKSEIAFTNTQKTLNQAIVAYHNFFQPNNPIINLNLNEQKMFTVNHVMEGNKSELHYTDKVIITSNRIEIESKLVSIRFFNKDNQITRELMASEIDPFMREYKKAKPLLHKIEKRTEALFQSILTDLELEKTPSQAYQR